MYLMLQSIHPKREANLEQCCEEVRAQWVGSREPMPTSQKVGLGRSLWDTDLNLHS